MIRGAPTIAYWEGEPLSSLSHEKLEEIICEQAQAIEQLRTEQCRQSVLHVRTLAEVARARRAF